MSTTHAEFVVSMAKKRLFRRGLVGKKVAFKGWMGVFFEEVAKMLGNVIIKQTD